MRARWAKEDLGRGNWQIVVTEIPYAVPKSRLIEKIAEFLPVPPLTHDQVDLLTTDGRQRDQVETETEGDEGMDLALSEQAGKLIRRVVPHERVCWHPTDPAADTFLPGGTNEGDHLGAHLRRAALERLQAPGGALELLLELRKDLVEERIASFPERLGFTLWSLAWSRPSLYRASTFLARLAARLGGRFGPGRAWTRGRDLPALARRRFRDLR